MTLGQLTERLPPLADGVEVFVRPRTIHRDMEGEISALIVSLHNPNGLPNQDWANGWLEEEYTDAEVNRLIRSFMKMCRPLGYFTTEH